MEKVAPCSIDGGPDKNLISSTGHIGLEFTDSDDIMSTSRRPSHCTNSSENLEHEGQGAGKTF